MPSRPRPKAKARSAAAFTAALLERARSLQVRIPPEFVPAAAPNPGRPHRARGKLGEAANPSKAMNGLEREFAAALEARRVAGEVAWYDYECLRLRIAGGWGDSRTVWYTPDFPAVLADGRLVLYETKGRWRPKDLLVLKTAATLYPMTFVAVEAESRDRAGRVGAWRFADFDEFRMPLMGRDWSRLIASAPAPIRARRPR